MRAKIKEKIGSFLKFDKHNGIHWPKELSYIEPKKLDIKLRNWQWDSMEVNIKRQQKKLFETIDYSIKKIKFYSNIAKRIKFSYSKKTIFKDIQRWPILTKDMVRNNFDDLINQKYLNQSNLNCSGGTTGEPIKLYQQKESVELINTIVNMQNEWGGLTSTDLLIQLWGNEDEIFRLGDSATGIIKISDRHYILNSFRMSEEDMNRYRKFINKKRPKMILAYVQSIFEFAKFIKNNNLRIYTPNSIMTSAGTLHNFEKKLIEEVFSCDVLNRYGSREVHSMACSCEENKGLHVDTFFHYLEILDEKRKAVLSEGGRGEVYITLFDNPVMPLIRYKIGDIATYTKKNCSCGRGLPLIKNINGRTVDIFINNKGQRIDGEYFTHLFYLKDFIRQFQVVQKDKDFILVTIVSDLPRVVTSKKKELSEMRDKIKLVMGEKCQIKFIQKKKIDLPKSGKFRYTISKIIK